MAKQLPLASEDLLQPQVAKNIVEEDLDQVDIPPAAINHEQSNQLQAKPAEIVTESTSTADVANNGSFVMPAEVSAL